MERSEAVTIARSWKILRWVALAVGLLVNVWAFWVMASEIGKEAFRFGQLPDASSSSGFLEWCKHVALLGWLPKDALHIHLSKKLTFATCNAVFLAVLFDFFARGNRRIACLVGSFTLLNLYLIFSPAVGNLP